MQFIKWQDQYSMVAKVARRSMSVDELYKNAIMREVRRPRGEFRWDVHMDLCSEWLWWHNGRPYYNLWPVMFDMLDRFNISQVKLLDVLQAPDLVIAVQFPDILPLDRSAVLIGVGRATRDFGDGSLEERVIVSATEQWRHTRPQRMPDGTTIDEYPTTTTFVSCPVSLIDRKTIGELFTGEQTLTKWQHIGLCILLMERNADLFEPDVLSADRTLWQKADEDTRRRLEAKACKRRKQRGYHVGRTVESIPHYRRPHPALYWTGKGRHTPKIVFRSGAIVKRSIATKAPTGRLGSYGEVDAES